MTNCRQIVPCQKSARDEALNITPGIETTAKIGVDRRSGTSTQRYTNLEEGEGWREEDEGDTTSERRERMRLRHFAPVGFTAAANKWRPGCWNAYVSRRRDWRT